MKKWLVFVGKKEEEAKKPSVDRRQWLVHGGGIPQLHVGGTIACRAAAEGQRYQRKQRTTTWRGRPHWVDGRCCHFGQGHIGPAPWNKEGKNVNLWKGLWPKTEGEEKWKLTIRSVTKNGGRREMETYDKICDQNGGRREMEAYDRICDQKRR